MSNMDHLVSIVTAIVTVCSAISSWLNHIVRSKQAAGQPVPGALLGGAAVTNVASVNIDKAIQLVNMLRAAKVPTAPAQDAQ